MILNPSKASSPERPLLRVGFSMLSALIIRYGGLAHEFESEYGREDRLLTEMSDMEGDDSTASRRFPRSLPLLHFLGTVKRRKNGDRTQTVFCVVQYRMSDRAIVAQSTWRVSRFKMAQLTRSRGGAPLGCFAGQQGRPGLCRRLPQWRRVEKEALSWAPHRVRRPGQGGFRSRRIFLKSKELHRNVPKK